MSYLNLTKYLIMKKDSALTINNLQLLRPLQKTR